MERSGRTQVRLRMERWCRHDGGFDLEDVPWDLEGLGLGRGDKLWAGECEETERQELSERRTNSDVRDASHRPGSVLGSYADAPAEPPRSRTQNIKCPSDKEGAEAQEPKQFAQDSTSRGKQDMRSDLVGSFPPHQTRATMNPTSEPSGQTCGSRAPSPSVSSARNSTVSTSHHSETPKAGAWNLPAPGASGLGLRSLSRPPSQKAGLRPSLLSLKKLFAPSGPLQGLSSTSLGDHFSHSMWPRPGRNKFILSLSLSLSLSPSVLPLVGFCSIQYLPRELNNPALIIWGSFLRNGPFSRSRPCLR